jgi:ABC-type xylose transport system permease subunit
MSGEFGNHFKEIIKSRSGLIIAALNWVLFVCFYFTRENSEQPIHLYYESVFFQVLLVLNAPAIICVALVFALLGYNDSVGNKYWFIKVFVALGFILAITTQWLLIGYGIEKIFRRKKNID